MTPPQNPSLPTHSCFTMKHTGRVLVLTSEVEIFPAFVPGTANVPSSKKYRAIYDTGATHSSISPQVVSDLGLPSVGATQVGVGGGSVTTTSHLVNIGLPNRVMFPTMRVAALALHHGMDVLIGMDIIGAGDFAVTHQQGKTMFSFRCPSYEEIDFVAQSQKKPPSAHSDKVGRNSACTCGSGKRYKRCCGINS
jgi:predicted aspartyl protease